jgi:hypothetical protein
MALKKDLTATDHFGIEVTIKDPYIRVAGLDGGKHAMLATVETLTADQSRCVSLEKVNFQPTLESKNFIAQAYDHLKTMDKYADAVNC